MTVVAMNRNPPFRHTGLETVVGLLSTSLLFCLIVTSVTAFKQPSFRVKPQDAFVKEGDNVTIRCEVNDVIGFVQWVKNAYPLFHDNEIKGPPRYPQVKGYPLFYDKKIAGHPRYTQVNDFANGVFNLIIRNMVLIDDANYDCQVSRPGLGDLELRSAAKLTIIMPPRYIEITDGNSDSKFRVNEFDEVTIECIARTSKPASKIIWLRGNNVIGPGQQIDTVYEEQWGWVKATTFNTRSKLIVEALLIEDGMRYWCEAHHECLSEPLKTSVQIKLKPSGSPILEGYTVGDKLEKGQLVKLRCKAKIVNSYPQLSWFKDGERVLNENSTTMETYMYKQWDILESTYSFVASISDNGIIIRCENSVTPVALYADVVLSVRYSARKVVIKGPIDAKAGDTVTMTCESSPSNPAATIKWILNNDEENKNVSSKVTPSIPPTSWTTKSSVTVIIPDDQLVLVYTCEALVYGMNDRVSATHIISVRSGPNGE